MKGINYIKVKVLRIKKRELQLRIKVICMISAVLIVGGVVGNIFLVQKASEEDLFYYENIAIEYLQSNDITQIPNDVHITKTTPIAISSINPLKFGRVIVKSENEEVVLIYDFEKDREFGVEVFFSIIFFCFIVVLFMLFLINKRKIKERFR